MLHSVHDMNAAGLNRVMSSLRRLEQDPETLECSRRRRFDSDEPPPSYSSGTTTEPPSPSFLRPRDEHEIADRLRQPFSNDELYQHRTGVHCSVASRFRDEVAKERHRLFQEAWKRDENHRLIYRGPDIFCGRAGSQREDIMVRHSIKKRWQQLGVWNPTWGIPGRVKARPHDKLHNWSWDWPDPPRKEGGYHQQQWRPEMPLGWPPQDEEDSWERAMRQRLERHGAWRASPSAPNSICEVDTDSRVSFFTSRPWILWNMDVEEETIRLRRVRIWSLEQAEENVAARWKARGDWKDSWVGFDYVDMEMHHRPGWRWPHECPSPEPADPNDMDFTPSEIDALEAIPPPTPPPAPAPDSLAEFIKWKASGGRLVFGWESGPTTPESPVLRRSSRIAKQITTPRRSARLAEKAQRKHLDTKTGAGAPKPSQRSTVKSARRVVTRRGR